MKITKFVALMAVLLMTVLCLTGCSSQTIGYRKYPNILVNPSVFGDYIKIRLPLDENKYLYSTYNCEYTEDGIDLTIHFTKSD